jgi:hypothetical protein
MSLQESQHILETYLQNKRAAKMKDLILAAPILLNKGFLVR